MTLRVPYLLAAVVALASLFYLTETKSLKAAPRVSAETLSGQTVDLAASNGSTRLITFWAPDCPISKRNIPALSALHEKFSGEGFDILAVAMPYSVPSEINSYVEQHKIDYPVAFDRNSEVTEAFPGVRFTPTTYLIDSHNNVVWKHIGRMTDELAASHIIPALRSQPLAKR